MYHLDDIENCLIIANREGDKDQVTDIIASYESSYGDGTGGYDLLRRSLLGNKQQLAEILLQNGCSVNCKDSRVHLTPLHFAAINGSLRLIEMLLNKGAQMDVIDMKGRTPLIIAIECGRESVVELFLSRGASTTVPGKSLFHYAAKSRNVKINQLVMKFAEDTEQLSEAFNFSVWLGSIDVVNLYLQNGYDVNFRNRAGRIALHYTVDGAEFGNSYMPWNYSHRGCHGCRNVTFKNEDLESLENINTVEWNWPDSESGNWCCAQTNCSSCSQNAHTSTQITCCSTQNNYSDSELYRFEHNDCSMKKLFLEDIEYARGEVTKLLVRNKADINAELEDGVTTLLAAVVKGRLEVIEALLLNNADVNRRLERNTGSTLWWEVFSHLCDCLEPIESSCYLLHFLAAEPWNESNAQMKTSAAELLISWGARLESESGEGWTPLRLAIRNKNATLVRILLRAGARVSMEEKHLAFKMSSFNFDIVKILLDNDMNVNSYHSTIAWMDNGLLYLLGEMAELLDRHKIKLLVVFLYLNRSESDCQRVLEEVSAGCKSFPADFAKKCWSEIVAMDRERLFDSTFHPTFYDDLSFSFFDVLTKSSFSLARHMRGANLSAHFTTSTWKLDFPIYASMLSSKLTQVEHWIDAQERFQTIFRNSSQPLPEICVEKILCYLSGDEVRRIIRSCDPRIDPEPKMTKKVAFELLWL